MLDDCRLILILNVNNKYEQFEIATANLLTGREHGSVSVYPFC